MSMSSKISRRQFVRNTAVLAGASLSFPAILRSANAEWQTAGRRGWVERPGPLRSQRNRLACEHAIRRILRRRYQPPGQGNGEIPGVATYQDFREMFAKLARASMPCRSPRPITPTRSFRSRRCAWQTRVLPETADAHGPGSRGQMQLQAEKSGVITQMGNQIHSASEYRTA
jgi:hypothetical protein